MKGIPRCFSFGLLICFTGATALAQAGAIMIAIDQMKVGAAPAEFEIARTGRGSVGQWTVVTDATAVKGQAIEQTSADPTDDRFPLAIYRPASANNLDVTVRFKAMSGKVDRAGGIAVRLSDPDNYYVVRANALEDNVRFYKVVRGQRMQLGGADLKVTPGEWHTLGLAAKADRFTISFDGKQLYTVTDATFAQAGKVALWTKADSVTRFDTMKIMPLP